MGPLLPPLTVELVTEILLTGVARILADCLVGDDGDDSGFDRGAGCCVDGVTAKVGFRKDGLWAGVENGIDVG